MMNSLSAALTSSSVLYILLTIGIIFTFKIGGNYFFSSFSLQKVVFAFGYTCAFLETLNFHPSPSFCLVGFYSHGVESKMGFFSSLHQISVSLILWCHQWTVCSLPELLRGLANAPNAAESLLAISCAVTDNYFLESTVWLLDGPE